MTAAQLRLPIDAPPQPVLNLTGLVYDIMRDGRWYTPYELQREIQRRIGVWHSDASTSARIRDLRKQKYGSYAIDKRIREGTKSYEYRLEDML